MEQMLYTILGAFLAIVGGIFMQKYQSYRDRKKEEQNILLHVNELLLEYSAIEYIDKESEGLKNESDRIKYELKKVQTIESIRKAAIRLKSKNGRKIGVKLSKFSLDKQIRSKENLYLLTRNVQMMINKELIEQYEKEIKEKPDAL